MVVYHGQDKLAEPSARTRLSLHVGRGEAFLSRELTDLLDIFCGNVIPVLIETLETGNVVVGVSHLFLELLPLRLFTVLKASDGLKDFLDPSWWVHQCLNLLNVSLIDVGHGDVQSILSLSAQLIIITLIFVIGYLLLHQTCGRGGSSLRRIGWSRRTDLPSALDYSGSRSGGSDSSSLSITNWS